MTTTRYVTADSSGIITVLATATDANGNAITQQVNITVNPLPDVPKCYNAIFALSPVQDNISSACAQFGVANTYYLGNPRNSVYVDESCSQLAPDGFYKTEENNWVNINSGAIRQRGSCSTIATTIDNIQRNIARVATPPGSGPQRFETGGVTNLTPPISYRVEGTRQQVFIPQPTFTEPAPTTVPIDKAFIEERAAFKAAQRKAQPVLTTTQEVVQQVVSQLTPPVVTPQPIFGCVDPTAINYNPNATVDDGSCQYQQRGGFTADNTEQFI